MTQIGSIGGRFSSVAYSLGTARGLPFRQPAQAAPQGQWQPLRGGRDGPVVIKVRVNNLLVDAFVDSGATRTAISRTLAARLGLASQGRARLAGLTGDLDCERTAPIRIGIGTTELPPMAAIVLDLETMTDAIRTSFDLIVGQDMFLGHEVEFDFVNHRFRLIAGGATGEASAHGSKVALTRMDDGLFAAGVRVEDAPGLAVLDLGSMLPLYISREFAAVHGLTAAHRTSTAVTIGIEGPAVHTTGRLSTLTFAGHVFSDIPFAVPGDWNLHAPIVLGLPLLARFDMRLGFGGRWARFRPQDADTPFSRDRSGLNVIVGGSGLEIIHVARGSPAERLGLLAGEFIVAVDGQPIDAHYLATCKGLGTAPVGTTYRLDLADGRKVTLQLDDYY